MGVMRVVLSLAKEDDILALKRRQAVAAFSTSYTGFTWSGF